MATSTGELCPNKLLLVWPTPIPDNVRAAFTMVFINIFGLINYVYEVLPKTDTFHLIIPLDCFEVLLNDAIYNFRQMVRIDIICDSTRDLKRMKHRFGSGCEKLQFYTLNSLLKSLWKAELDRALVSSHSIDGSAISNIISFIEHRLSAKRSNSFIHRSQILQRFSSKSLHGLPVKNTNDFDPDIRCPSCKLVYQQLWKLECGHRQCEVSVNIQKSCVICSKVVLRDKVFVDQDWQMKMQDFSIHCSGCEWIGTLKDYQVHLKQNHYELITCSVCNQQVDENSFQQQYLTETNQEIFVGNFSSSDPDIRVISLNGTCIWEISNIEDIKNNAANGEQKSIYSAPFYLFPNGYKMCLRLYINGDLKARHTYMSLFFVIMRGENDANLQWPFKFKVKFTLIDQSTTNDNQHHISQSFWPNTTSTTAICFERPKTNMNVACGIPMFCPLALFKENQNRYVRHDTMYIKVEIDLFTDGTTLSLMDGAGELPNDEEHVDEVDDDISVMICGSDTA